jgi:lipoprotein-releasing system permease protein
LQGKTASGSDPLRAGSSGRASGASSILRRRDHWFLLVLWVLSWASALLLWQEPPAWAVRAAQAGLVAFFGLVAWWAIAGFTGYEHVSGLRIIARNGTRLHRSGLLWVWLAASTAGLVALNLGHKSVIIVIAVALSTVLALLTVLLRSFSVFGTIAAFGVAIGVSGLIVVQSVATGFQHEFERRVLGVYAHINVTRAFGISEYRRFESYLRTVPGVVGASPFVYYGMALAPVDLSADLGQPTTEHGPASGSERADRNKKGLVLEYDSEDDETEFRRASVLVKGIEPSTADEVIDIVEHLERGSGRRIPLDELKSTAVLEPVPDRDDDQLPPAVAAMPDPRGEDGYEKAVLQYRGASEEDAETNEPATGDDDPDGDAAPPGDQRRALDASQLPTVFIGNTLARELDLAIGDTVSLADPGASFDHTQPPRFQHYRVAGTFQAGFHEYDSRLIYVHIRELQRFKYRGKDIVSGVDLRLADPNLAPEVGAVLAETVGDDEYSLLEWQDLNKSLFQSIQTQKSIITIIISLVSTVAGFNVLAALWTMVVRRGAEIAIMMSMGATEAGVARIFQFAGMAVGVTGAISGLGLGLVLCWLVELYGYTLDPEVYFIERLPVEISLIQVAAVLALTLGICFVATIPPALRAARLRPVDGLRYE